MSNSDDDLRRYQSDPSDGDDESGSDSEEEFERERAARAEPIDVDSDDDDDDDDDDIIDSPAESDGYADDDESVQSHENGDAREEVAQENGENGEEDEASPPEDSDDDLTWESRSTVSEAEEYPSVGDEWFPLPHRRTRLPNFAMPTSTRAAILARSDRLAKEEESESSAMSSDEEDTDFQKYEGVMRPNPTRVELSKMILDYFIFHGNSEMIDIVCKELDLPIPEEDIKDMNMRNGIKQLILEGEMEQVIDKLNEISPTIMEDDFMNYVVRKQHIIEMIRRDTESTEPIMYFRTHLIRNGKRPDDDKMDVLERVFALLVFGEDDDSQYHIFFHQNEREWTAKHVNSAIQFAMGKPKSSRVDTMCKAVIWMRNELRTPEDPASKTTENFAEELLSKPYGFQELIDKAIAQKDVDYGQDLA